MFSQIKVLAWNIQSRPSTRRFYKHTFTAWDVLDIRYPAGYPVSGRISGAVFSQSKGCSSGLDQNVWIKTVKKINTVVGFRDGCKVQTDGQNCISENALGKEAKHFTQWRSRRVQMFKHVLRIRIQVTKKCESGTKTQISSTGSYHR